MSITRHHNEWLSLVPNSGPFLSLLVLAQAFPQGLDAHDADHARRLRMAFEEWDGNQLGKRPDPGIHRAWVKFVLGETLGCDELLAEGQAIPQTLKSEVAEYGETLRPDWVVNDPATKKTRMLVQVFPRSQSLTKPVVASRWKTSPDSRMMQLLHDTGIRLGIVTNGDHWMLVNAPKNETTGYVSWYANLWLEEPITLRAFRTLLSADRFFSVPENETLDADKVGLLDRSANDQQEVTDQLGYQVRKAVEVLVQALDKADQEHGRKLLADVNEKFLYESALTVMMRLVFLFCAEERELLLLGDDLYDKNYAVSTLREQLRVTADQFGEEILGLRYDAWNRLLTSFRAVYAGAKHDRLKLPAYGGNLFNPDRFPFLEGRKLGTSWKTAEATPLPVSNRTVLHLLEALQVLQTKIGNSTEARKISFRALDIEQIGHVYEGLLDHTAKRTTEPVLGLAGTRDKEPEIAVAELERIAAKGQKELLKFLKDQTGRSESAISKGLNVELVDQLASRFRTACQDSDLWKRVKRFAGLVRLDPVGYPVVITTGSVFVTSGTDRRSSGTHYTPKSLTEPIVQYTLEPLVYIGPAEGLPNDQWKLRSAKELLALKICDMACGSGAFLVQACRYMAARLLETWDAVQRANPGMVHITPEGEASTGKTGEMLIPDDPDERQTYALRIVAQRCLYGVDINPLAAEMAKLSLWLLTLAKDKPFEFLDHAIRCGDSLVGIHNIEQLRKFNLDGKGEDNRLFLVFLDEQIKDAIALRRQITEMQAVRVDDVEAQDRMLRGANEKLDRLKCVADLLIAAEFVPGSATDKRMARDDAAIKVAVHFNDSDLPTFRQEAAKSLAGQVTFHWPLEFPEVMIEGGGFNAFLGNPPFIGNKYWLDRLPQGFQHWATTLIGERVGKTDVVAIFFRRSYSLLSSLGRTGLVATTTSREGDTLRIGFEWISQHGEIYRALSQRNWPGSAGVHVCIVWFGRNRTKHFTILDDQPVSSLSPSLTASPRSESPELLKDVLWAFKGTDNSKGASLILEQNDEWYSRLVSRKSPFLRAYITGEDITGGTFVAPTRFVVDCMDLSFDQIEEQCPLTAEFLLSVVKPQRTPEELAPYPGMSQRWWQMCRHRASLYGRIRTRSTCIAIPVVAKHVDVVEMPTQYLFTNKVCVVEKPCDSLHLFLLTSLFEAWVMEHGGTMRVGTLTITVEKCLQTVPPILKEIATAPQAIATWYELVRYAMSEVTGGLTNVFNALHDHSIDTPTAQRLRTVRHDLDYLAATAFGMVNLELGHGFYETKQGVRYTICEPARREVLARLLTLNHKRYAEEVKQGLHEKKPNPASKIAAKPAKSKARATLFDDDDATFPRPGREDFLCGLVCDLVNEEPGLPVSAYIDYLVIALGYERHQRLLIGQDRTDFAKLCKVSPLASWSATDRIPWAELQNLLTRRKAIKPEGQALIADAELTKVRNSYSAAAPELIALLRKASTELRELQAATIPQNGEAPNEITPEKAEILRAFVNDKGQWYGVAA